MKKETSVQLSTDVYLVKLDQLLGNDIKRVIFSWTGDKLVPTRHCTLVGTFKQITVSDT